MKKGFTLIELLAVIVILAIIALIATPIILNIINNTKEESVERSIELYKKAIQNAIVSYQINNNKNPIGIFSPKELENGELSKNIITNGSIDLKIEYDSEDVESEIIEISEDGNIYLAGIKINGEPYLKKYENGEIVYFDVLKGQGCGENIYKSSYDETKDDFLNSSTGYNGIKKPNDTSNKNSCLKFYAFNDNGSETLNLILDHNITSNITWGPSESNKDKTLLNQLEIDTKDWKNIDARLIELDEINEITKNTKFDGKSWYYLDTKTQTASTTCKSGNRSGCKYGWLYDRTHQSCEDYGCLNNSDAIAYGYWTNTPHNKEPYAWIVNYKATLSNSLVNDDYRGIRPVITVSKSLVN